MGKMNGSLIFQVRVNVLFLQRWYRVGDRWRLLVILSLQNTPHWPYLAMETFTSFTLSDLFTKKQKENEFLLISVPIWAKQWYIVKLKSTLYWIIICQ